jgi:hypothetical protein
MANQCPTTPTSAIAPPPGQSFALLPFTHFTNQTLRQIETVFLRPVMRSAKEASLEAHFVLQPA